MKEMNELLTCEKTSSTVVVVGIGFKKQPDDGQHFDDAVSHSADDSVSSNGGGGSVLDTLDKLSDKSQLASVSDDIQTSVHATQESNPSHHRFLDATTSTSGSAIVSHELRDSESSSGPSAKSQNLVGTTDNKRVKYWNNIIQFQGEVVKKCPWRIQIIDGTALIETITSLLEKETDISSLSYGAKKEKKMLGKKKQRVRRNYEVYSRKELEALRFQGLEAQKRRWVAVYSALGAALQKEYDGLVVHFHPKNIKTNNKKKKNVNVKVIVKVKVKVNSPLFQNQPGPRVAKQEYRAKPLYNEEWATGKFERRVQNVF